MSLVLTEDHGPVRHLVLNRPEKRNALNDELILAIREAAAAAAADRDVLCVVVRGAGPMFSAGMDFGGLAALAADPGRLREFRRPILETWNLLEEMAKPTICQVHGACIGGAMELALACDLRVMAADALIGMPETRVGLIPDVGGSSRLPAVVGLGRAKELVMTGRMIDGTEAERIGLVNRVAPADELDAATAALVRRAPGLRAGGGRARQARARRGGEARAGGNPRARGRGPGAVRAHRGLRRGDARLRAEAPAGVQRALTALLGARRRGVAADLRQALAARGSERLELGQPLLVATAQLGTPLGRQQVVHVADGLHHASGGGDRTPRREVKRLCSAHAASGPSGSTGSPAARQA